MYLSNNLIVSFWVKLSIKASNATSIVTSGTSASLTASNTCLEFPSLSTISKSSKEGTLEYVS